MLSNLNIEDRRFTQDHEWIVEADGEHFIGITDFAARELGELVFVELPNIGQTLKKGDVIAVVESTKTASDVYAPVDLEIVQVNSELKTKPNLVNENPFRCWIVKVKVKNKDDLSALLSWEEYKKLVGG